MVTKVPPILGDFILVLLLKMGWDDRGIFLGIFKCYRGKMC